MLREPLVSGPLGALKDNLLMERPAGNGLKGIEFRSGNILVLELGKSRVLANKIGNRLGLDFLGKPHSKRERGGSMVREPTGGKSGWVSKGLCGAVAVREEPGRSTEIGPIKVGQGIIGRVKVGGFLGPDFNKC